MANVGQAIATAAGLLARVPLNGAANGTIYHNTANPVTAHIPASLLWVRGAAPNTGASLTAHLVHYCGVDQAVPAAGKIPINVGVVVAMARLSAERFFGLRDEDLNRAEMVRAAAVDPAIDLAHADAIASAVADLAESSARLWGLGVYVAISFATTGHHHLPAKTGKLFTTTRTVLGLERALSSTPGMEGWVFHDAFHPMGMAWKSDTSRRVSLRPLLGAVALSNLAKRLPVKAADTAVAMNYSALLTKAREYVVDSGEAALRKVRRANAELEHAHTVAVAAAAARVPPGTVPLAPELEPEPPLVNPLPAGLVPPAALGMHIEAYKAADALTVVAAVNQLVQDANRLAKPSAYLAGYLLGKLQLQREEPELTLRGAKRHMTILGVPAYERISQDFPGTFDAGVAMGRRRPAANLAAGFTADTLADITQSVGTVAEALVVPPAAPQGQAAAPAPVDLAALD